MFSDHLRKIEIVSGRNLLLLAGALVIACQLVAMAMVADGQVQKAALRDSRLSAQNVAMAQCFESSTRFDRQSCLRQAGADESTVASQDLMQTSFSPSSAPSN